MVFVRSMANIIQRAQSWGEVLQFCKFLGFAYNIAESIQNEFPYPFVAPAKSEKNYSTTAPVLVYTLSNARLFYSSSESLQ